jgi:DNA-binding response OmpR family regulator
MMPQNKTVLIIDDEPDFTDLVKMRLESQGYRVETAAFGEEGIQKALAAPPNLILLDVMMPGIDGFQTLHRLRGETQTRRIPVIMLTAKGESKSIFKAQELGATDYLIKPCDSAELVGMVRKYT